LRNLGSGKKNASSSYVWWLITAAGQLADCPGEDSLVQSSAPSVNKKMRPSTTSSRVVYFNNCRRIIIVVFLQP